MIVYGSSPALTQMSMLAPRDHILKDHMSIICAVEKLTYQKTYFEKTSEKTWKTFHNSSFLNSITIVWQYEICTKLLDYGLLSVVITKTKIVNDKRFCIYLKCSVYWTKRHTFYNKSRYEMSITYLWFYNWQHVLCIEMLVENTNYDIF